MPVSRRSWRSCSWLYSASAKAESVLRRVRLGKHSKRKRKPQSHWARSARGRKSSGASSRPNHFRIVKGAVGLAQGSEWLTEICPPFAKLVSSAGSGWRSTTITSWPLCARYHALVVPMTPAPRTITLMPASDKNKRGKARAISPWKRIYTFDFHTASKSFRRLHALRTCLFSRVRNHFLPLLTESLDAKSDYVTGLQPRLGRLHPQRHAS